MPSGMNGLRSSLSSHRPPYILITGHSGSGKTHLMTRMVEVLVGWGLDIGCVKHCPGGFQLDREGSDSALYALAGAREVAIAGPDSLAILRKTRDVGLSRVLAEFTGVDVVLVEGFSSAPGAAVWVSREGSAPRKREGGYFAHLHHPVSECVVEDLCRTILAALQRDADLRRGNCPSR